MKSYIIPLYYVGWSVMGAACGGWVPFAAAIGIGMIIHSVIAFVVFIEGEER